MESYSLSIIIPTYNGLFHLARCLASVQRHAPNGTQIIVVDDASTDGTAHWLRTHHPYVELIEQPKNHGFCQAINTGLARARGDIIELLNNDTEVYPGWAEVCFKHFDDPRVGSVAPLATRMDCDQTIDSCGQEYHICGWAYDRGHRQHLDLHAQYCKAVFGPSASCGFYRRSALERTGPLWTLLGAYFEDTDLAFRLRWAGYRCVFEPRSRVAHWGSASYAMSPRVTWLLSRNEEIVYWANMPRGKLLLGLVPHIGFVAIRCVRKLVQGQLRTYLAGKLDAMRLWRTIVERRAEVRALREGRPIELALQENVNVLRRGLVWLSRRQCA